MKAFIQKLYPINQEDFEEFSSIFTPIYLDKNEIFLEEGSQDRYVYFLEEGFIRLFYLNDGKDYSLCFFLQPSIFTTLITFEGRTFSPFSLQAISDAVVYRALKEDLHKIYDRNPRLEKIGRLMAEYLLSEMINKYLELITLKTKERYQFLIKKWGRETFYKIPFKYLASFLKVEPESLSRIRRAMY